MPIPVGDGDAAAVVDEGGAAGVGAGGLGLVVGPVAGVGVLLEGMELCWLS